MYDREINALQNGDITFIDMVDLIMDCYPEAVAVAAARATSTEDLIEILSQF